MFEGIFPSIFTEELNKKKEFELYNTIEFTNTCLNLINSRLDTFKWEGLPIGVNERTLELALLFRGFACLYKERDTDNFIALPALPTSNLNASGDFLFAWIYGLNGFNKEVKLYLPGLNDNSLVRDGLGLQSVSSLYDAVLCRENATGYPFIYNILSYSKRISNVIRAMDVATENMKIPYIIKTDESLVNSIKGVYKKVRDNEPIIISSKNLDLTSFDVISTNVNTNILSEFREQYNFLYSEIQNRMGVFHNAQPDKNAHILEDELHSDDLNTESELNKCLTYRKYFCEQCNEAFNLNMNVLIRNRNVTYDEVEDYEYMTDEKEGDINEE